ERSPIGRSVVRCRLPTPRIGLRARRLTPGHLVSSLEVSMSFRSFAVGLSMLAGLAGLGALHGCALSPVESDEVSVAIGAIKGGYADPNDTAVVDIVWLENQYFSECTGSLIAPNLVLTARHCVADIKNLVGGGVDCEQSSFSAPASASSFYVST